MIFSTTIVKGVKAEAAFVLKETVCVKVPSMEVSVAAVKFNRTEE